MDFWVVGICFGDGEHAYFSFGPFHEAYNFALYHVGQGTGKVFLWDLYSGKKYTKEGIGG